MPQWALFFFTFSLLPNFGWAVERELMGVSLGTPYKSAIKNLKNRFGQPIQTSSQGSTTFALDEKNQLVIAQGTSEKIDSIQITGNEPIKGFKFLGRLNLSFPEAFLNQTLPKSLRLVAENGDKKVYESINDNFLLETEKGRVSVIKISFKNTFTIVEDDQGNLIPLSENENETLSRLGKKSSEALNQVTHDPLKEHCIDRYPLRFSKGLFLADLNVAGGDRKSKIFTFLLDTGYSATSLKLQTCKQLGCKVDGEIQLNSKSKLKKTTPVTISIGPHEYGLPAPSLDESETLSQVGADGVLGGDILLARETILNLKNEYICFPKNPVYELADLLKWQKVPALYEGKRIWLNLLANGKSFKDYFLDTGADRSSLLGKDIEVLSLKELRRESRMTAMTGPYQAKTFGPVTIGLAGLTRTLASVAEAPSPDYRKIGNDILHSMIIAMDSETKYVWISQ